MRYVRKRGVVLVLLAAIVFLYPLLTAPRHRIDEEHFELIQEGMTRADVEAIFGAVPGKYDWAEPDDSDILVWNVTAVAFSPDGRRLALPMAMDQTVKLWNVPFGAWDGRLISWPGTVVRPQQWVSRHGAFTVYFDGENRVSSRSPWPKARIVPPWKRWWQSVWKQ